MPKPFELIATRRFSMADQEVFARLTGDVNPMHMDPVRARRTQAGVPVVHGMNALMWMLDRYCSLAADAHIGEVSVNFERFVPLDADVELHLRHAADAKLELRLGGARLIRATIRERPNSTPRSLTDLAPDVPLLPAPAYPLDLAPEQIATARGRMALGGIADYPDLQARVGGPAVAAMGGLSTLVGMIAPGLHSIFSGADLVFTQEPATPAVLAYQADELHDVFRLLSVGVAAQGVAGGIRAFLRPAPVRQPGSSELADVIEADAFSGVRALVIGGSRGLGELAAKLLAAGGAEVAISYATGRDDAEAVVADIVAQGGRCTALQIDASLPLAPQLDGTLPFAPHQVYYFASGKIAATTGGFSPKQYAAFNRIYIDAFSELCAFFAATPLPVTIYYPSTVYVVERPRGLTEYAMAKGAAEILCADLNLDAEGIRIVVDRLPPLPTDQTAAVTPIKTTSPLPVMLNALRAMQAASRTS